MDASGNHNQPIPLDVQKLFKTAVPINQSPPQQPPPPISSSPPFFHPQNQQLYMPPSTSATAAPQNFHNFDPDGISVSYASALMNPNNAGNQILALINSPPQNLDQPHQMLPPPEFMVRANFDPVMAPNMPIGRRLAGNHVVYDVDVRIPGEVRPQLDVTPITKYGSDPQLVLGRQIGVNKSYICYGLKGGNIRILNINTALRSLLRGHTQRVTDMAFFAEDVHLLASVSLEGIVCVWKVTEGQNEDDIPEISGKIVIAVQILGDGEYVHPRVCWHRHKQEILVVAIGKYVLRIDTTKVGKNAGCSPDMSPLQCSIDKLIDGVQLVGKHDGDVTDLSMCQWMATRLVSASTDGTIKIWEDRKTVPLAVLRPHDGQPVYSAAFLTAPHRPDHIILVTGGPLNREVKIWTSGSEEGWLLPSNTESWTCTQTLDLKSSSESQVEDAFFNQVAALSEAGLVLLANAKKNAIYVVHLEYGSCPAATRMDYISEFTVTMPILSIIATFGLPDEHSVKVYCVQTHAIQQYELELCQCIPPPLENLGLEKSNSSLSHDVGGFGAFDTDISRIAPPPLPPSPRLTRKVSGFQSPSPRSRFEPASQFSDHVDNHDTFKDSSSLDYGSRSNEKKIATDDTSSPRNPPFIFKHPTHLVTPSEILMAASSIESNHQDLVDNSDVTTGEVEVNVVGEARSQYGDFVSNGESQELSTENAERLFGSQASDLGVQMARESGRLSSESYDVVSEPLAQPHSNEEGIHDSGSDATGKQSPAPTTKGRKQKGKFYDASSQSLAVDSSNEPGVNSKMHSSETLFPQISAMQETLNQLMSMQKEMQKQMSNLVNLPVAKEGRRLEAALGRSIEKAVKANNDTLWARQQEENANYEKSSRDQTQQITSFITNHVNKDLAIMLEKAVKKELAPLGQTVARTITPSVEKTIASTVAESFQRGVGDKAVNQLEKSVNSKLEATVARQIQAQFQTSGRQAIQDGLKSSIEVSVIPAFEMSCKAMSQQVDASFQKGLIEHMNSANLNLEAAHSPLAHALRDSMNSASSIARTLSGDFADNQRKLMALAVAGATSNAASPLVSQLSNGSLSEKVDVPIDPKNDLSRLISQRKYEEAFGFALQRSDLSIVSWLCLKVDLRAILAIDPLPLSQGVLISLLQQLACDVNNETSRKLGWMTDVAAAINPSDQMIAMHVRPIFEQVYKILHQLHSSPAITGVENSSIRLLMHVINSVLMTCK